MSPKPDPPIDPHLEAYRFHERDWAGYDELCDAFEHEIPAKFNTATYVCDRWAEAAPDRTAVTIVGADGTATEYTFGELYRTANQLAHFLERRGVGPGDRIAVSGVQSVECLVTHFAAWKLGAISVPVSIRYGPDGLAYRLADSGASVFVASPSSLEHVRELSDDLDALTTVVSVGAIPTEGEEIPFDSAVEGRSVDLDPRSVEADDGATIMYTSGTTGSPKGVLHGHRLLLGLLPGFLTGVCNMEIRATDLLHTPAEWSWLGSLYSGVFSSLYYGIPVIGDADPRFDPAETLSLLDAHDVTILGGAATIYRMMMDVPDVGERYDLTSLRVVVQGGEPFGQRVVDWLREAIGDVAIHEGYGQTETGTIIRDCEALGVAHRSGYMGRPIPGVEVGVLDLETPEPLDADELGEIALRYGSAPSYFETYWRRPDETTMTRSAGWHRMGDLGERSEAGYYAFHSRTDDVIISAAYRIGPAEIEESLEEHEAVSNAGVIGVPDETRGEVPKAFVMLGEGYEPSADLREELQNHVETRLATYEYPRELEFVDELPKTTTGKVRRRVLREWEGLIESA